jgi:hypothetical protein
VAEVKFKVVNARWGYEDEVYEGGVEHEVDADDQLLAALAAAESAGVIVVEEGELPTDAVQAEDDMEFYEKVQEIRAELLGDRDAKIVERVRALGVSEDGEPLAVDPEEVRGIHDEENEAYEAAVGEAVEERLVN